MGFTSADLSRTYTSFGGVDIRIVIDGETVGQAQAVSYAVQRAKGPIYTLGHADPWSFARGKRGIAGTVVALMLDQHLVLSTPFADRNFLADKDEIFATVADLNDASGLDDLGPLDPGFTFDASDLSGAYQVSKAWYMDQLPPFDFVLVAVNEYGKAATMRIYGVEIMNEGSGVSIDDLSIESQMTWIARTILPWQRMGSWDMTVGTFIPS